AGCPALGRQAVASRACRSAERPRRGCARASRDHTGPDWPRSKGGPASAHQGAGGSEGSGENLRRPDDQKTDPHRATQVRSQSKARGLSRRVSRGLLPPVAPYPVRKGVARRLKTFGGQDGLQLLQQFGIAVDGKFAKVEAAVAAIREPG